MVATQIEEVVQVGPPGQEQEVRTTADPTIEYVPLVMEWLWAWQSAEQYLRALPNPIDDISRDWGSRIYDEDMPRDPQVYSTLSILVMAVLAEGVMIIPAKETEDPEFSQAKKISDFMTWAIENLRRPFIGVLYELIEGMLKLGHKTGELIYDDKQAVDSSLYPGKPLLLVDIKTKPHDSTAFVVDNKNNVAGLFPVMPGTMLPLDMVDEQGRQIEAQMIPRQKFVIPTHKPQNGDPRGTSHLKPVYTPWWKKQQLTPEHLAYIARFAQPALYETLDEKATDWMELKDPVTGQVLMRKPMIQANNEALMRMHSGSVKTSKFGAKLDVIQAQGEGAVFQNSYDHEDRQIAKGILMQTLTTEEGKHMARAASQTHQDIFGILIAFIRELVEWTIRNEVFKPFVEYNYGAGSMHLIPRLSLGDTDSQDMAPIMTAIASMMRFGALHWTQLPKIWEMLNLPPADQKIWQAEMEQKMQAAQAAADAAQNPQPNQDGQDGEGEGDNQDGGQQGAA